MTAFDPFGWRARRKARRDVIMAQRMRDEVKAEHRAKYMTCRHGHTLERGTGVAACGCGTCRPPTLGTIWR